MIIFTNSQSLTLTSINNTALHTNALHSFAFATLKTQVKIMATKTQAKIPVVDLSNLDLKPGTKTWFSARKDVCHALEECGCFVVEISNKIPSELHNTIFSTFGKLFEFPTETKMKFTSERPFHGYFTSPVYERLVIDNATSTDVTQEFTNIFWPNGNHHVR